MSPPDYLCSWPKADTNLLMPPIDGELFCSMLNILVTEVFIPVEIELTSAEFIG